LNISLYRSVFLSTEVHNSFEMLVHVSYPLYDTVFYFILYDYICFIQVNAETTHL